MTKNQIFDVLIFIRTVYPNFEIDQNKIDVWHKLLKNNNPALVMKNAEIHAMEHKFPPTIADIKAPPKQEAHRQDYLEKIKLWEGEASGGPKC